MKKRILALVMSFSLVPCNAFADWNSEIGISAVEPARIMFNGQDKGIVDDVCDGNAYVKYTSIAELAGYKTEYINSTRTIISRKGNRTVTIPLDASQVTVTEDAKNSETIYVYPTVRNDRLYIPYHMYSELLDVSVSVNKDANTVIHANDIGEIADYIYKKTENLGEYLALVSPEKFAFQHSEGRIESTLNAPNFGTTITGECDLSSDLAYNDGILKMSLNADANGIYNLIKVLFAAIPGGDIEDFNFNKPIDFEMYAGVDAAYIKSQFFAKPFMSLASEKAFTGIEREYRKLPNESADKFIKVSGDKIPSEICEAFGSISNPRRVIADMFAQFAVSNCKEYSGIITTSDVLCSFFDESHLVINKTSENTASVSFKLDCSDLKKLINASLETADEIDYEESELKKLIENITFSVKGDITVTKDELKSEMKIDFLLSDIPNAWDIEIGSISFKISTKGVGKTKVENISLPKDYIEI